MAEVDKRIPTAKKNEKPKEKHSVLIFSDPAGNADKKCFFITPIGDDNDPIRRETDGILTASIIPALMKCGIVEKNVFVSHKINTSGRIDKQIMTHLFDDDLVIANLSEQNPNVMYELAVRHFIGKPIILIARKGTKYPFDIHNERTIPFVNDIMGSKDLIVEIEKEILALDNYNADNIIYESIKQEKIQEAILAAQNYTVPSNAIELIMDQLKGMASDIQNLNQKYENGFTRSEPTILSPRNSFEYHSEPVFRIRVEVADGTDTSDILNEIVRRLTKIMGDISRVNRNVSMRILRDNIIQIDIIALPLEYSTDLIMQAIESLDNVSIKMKTYTRGRSA